MNWGRWRGGTAGRRWRDRCQQPGKHVPEVQDIKSYKFLGSYIHLHHTWETGHHKHTDVQCFACHFCSLCHKKMLCPDCLLCLKCLLMSLLGFCCLPVPPSPPLPVLPTPLLRQHQDITPFPLQLSPSPASAIPPAAPPVWNFLLSLLPTQSPSRIQLLPKLCCFLSLQIQSF